MSQVGSNLKECKDCKANGVTTMVLWMQNPANPVKRMPADYKTLLETGQYVAHKCPYWRKNGTGTVSTQNQASIPQLQASRPGIAESRMTQVPPPFGQTILPTGNELKLDVNTSSILTNMVLALQEVADKIGDMNQYLEILANREVKANPGIKSALQAKDDRVIHGQELLDKLPTKIGKDFDPKWCDHDEMGTINDDTGICSNCGTSFPGFKKEREEGDGQEQQEFPDEDQLEEIPSNRRQRDPDAFPPI